MIRWICTGIHVSRSPHYAVHNHTGDSSSRASPDACYPSPGTVWLSAGVPYLAALCGGPQPHGDCGIPVLLALERVPDCAGVSRWEPGRVYRSRRSALPRCPVDYLDALADALPRCPPQKSPPGLWLVPDPLELCHARHDTPGPTWHRGVRRNRAPLAPRDRLGVETGQAGGQR